MIDEFAADMTKAGKAKEIVGLAWLGYAAIIAVGRGAAHGQGRATPPRA